VDIEEFYGADERRRRSSEIELGTEWRDAHDVRYELNWVQDTGEVYVMREPVPSEWADPFGGVHTNIRADAPADGMTVAVIANIASHGELDRILSGWEQAMAGPDGIAWLVRRIGEAGVGASAPDVLR